MAIENFVEHTNINRVEITTLTRPVGGGRNAPLQLPKAGYLSTTIGKIAGSVAGTLSAPNAFGFSSVLRRLSIRANMVGQLVDLSGQGYHWLYRRMIDSGYFDGIARVAATANTAVTATTFDISFLIDHAINPLSTRGLYLTQNETTNVTLELDWLADASVATGATVTATCVVAVEFYDAPAGEQNQPPQNEIHAIEEFNEAIPSTADYTYNPMRGYEVMRFYHGIDMGAGVTIDDFSNMNIRINQSILPFRLSAQSWDLFAARYSPTRYPSTLLVDYAGWSGLGKFGSGRDWLPSMNVTDYAHIFTPVSAGTLFTIMEQLKAVNLPSQ